MGNKKQCVNCDKEKNKEELIQVILKPNQALIEVCSKCCKELTNSGMLAK